MANIVLSRAKINLNLHILGRRPDSYHALFSLVCFADYGDRLSFSVGGEEDRLEVTGGFWAGHSGGKHHPQSKRFIAP